MAEKTQTAREHFLLIEDFRLSLQKAPFRIDRLEDSEEVLQISKYMQDALSLCTQTLDTIQIADVWNALRGFINPDKDFVVSLDGDFLIRNPDAVIEITRAARTIEEAEAGIFVRIPRSIGTGVLGQVKRVVHSLALSEKKEVVLFDDGLGTGNSMKHIVELFNGEDVPVSRIVVLANPQRYSQIIGVPVEAVFSIPDNSAWLNERDLYWGLPRSGVSLIPRGKNIGLGGVPYTSSKVLIQNRIGLDTACSERFLVTALELNAKLWSLIDHSHARNYPFRDCPRLSVYSEAINLDPNRSISQFIESLVLNSKVT